MEKEVTSVTFIEVVLKDGTRIVRPLATFGGSEYVGSVLARDGHDLQGAEIRTISGKFWGRMVEPGMVQATPWQGPYDSRSQAREALGECQ